MIKPLLCLYVCLYPYLLVYFDVSLDIPSIIVYGMLQKFHLTPSVLIYFVLIHLIYSLQIFNNPWPKRLLSCNFTVKYPHYGIDVIIGALFLQTLCH